MDKKILMVLANSLRFDEQALRDYWLTVLVRMDKKREKARRLLQMIVQSQGSLFEVLDSACGDDFYIQELRILNSINLSILDSSLPDELRNYLTLFRSEVSSPYWSSPSKSMGNSEYYMLNYFQESFSSSEEHDEIVLHGMRLVLQSWLLYPEAICDRVRAEAMIDGLINTGVIL